MYNVLDTKIENLVCKYLLIHIHTYYGDKFMCHICQVAFVHHIPSRVSTLESGINVALRLLIFRLFSRGYGLIPDFIV